MYQPHVFLGALVLLLTLGSGCSGRQLLNRKQLAGADPAYDLASNRILHKLRSTPSHKLSVRGVRLLDTVERAKKLWGPPSAIKGRQNRYLWTDAKGTLVLRLIVFKAPNQKGVRIRQIDVFSSYSKKLHPDNQPLFDPENIASPSWRERIFGLPGKTLQRPFDTRYLLPGFRMIVFSKLLRLRQKKATLFTLHLTSEALRSTLKPRQR